MLGMISDSIILELYIAQKIISCKKGKIKMRVVIVRLVWMKGAIEVKRVHWKWKSMKLN